MANDGATTGKAISFNLVNDDLHLYQTVRDIFLGELENDSAKVNEALAGLDPSVRALVQSRLAPVPAKPNLSHREVFVRALRECMAARDAIEDARAAAEATENAGGEDGTDPAPAEAPEPAEAA